MYDDEYDIDDHSDYHRSAANPAKWIAIGCLAAVLLIGGCVGGFALLGYHLLTNNDALVQAVEIARADPRVRQAIGTPIEQDFLPQGSINSGTSGGEASLTIGLSGPKGDATLLIEAHRAAGAQQWTYTQLLIQGPDGEEWSLLADDANEESDAPTQATGTAVPP